MLPMVAEAEAAGAEWHLCYGGRSRSSMAFVDELGAYGDRVTLVPPGRVRIPRPRAILAEPRADTLVYVLWPRGTARRGRGSMRAAGWPAGALHLERFAAKEAEVPDGGERSFELVLAGSGVTLRCRRTGLCSTSIQDAGISVLGSCHEGICGTCEQIVLEGEVDHRDSVLNESEQGGERRDDGVRVPCLVRPAGPGPVSGVRCMSATGAFSGAVPTDCWYALLASSAEVGRELLAVCAPSGRPSCCSAPRRTGRRTRGPLRAPRLPALAPAPLVGDERALRAVRVRLRRRRPVRLGADAAAGPVRRTRRVVPGAASRTAWCGSGSASPAGRASTAYPSCRGWTEAGWATVGGHRRDRRRLPAAARELRRRHPGAVRRTRDRARRRSPRRRRRSRSWSPRPPSRCVGSSRRRRCPRGRPRWSGATDRLRDHCRRASSCRLPSGSTTGTRRPAAGGRTAALRPSRHARRRGASAGCTGGSAGTSPSETRAPTRACTRCSPTTTHGCGPRWRRRRPSSTPTDPVPRSTSQPTSQR